jgi:glucose/arabinose dehydrogenase
MVIFSVKRLRSSALIFVFAFHLTAAVGCAQATRQPPPPARDDSQASKGAATPLAHYEITPASLPPPNATEDAVNPPDVIPRPRGAQLRQPPGFEIGTFAEGGFERPRWMALAPNGDVFVADSEAGRVIVLRDTNGDGAADARFTFASGLKQPFGMAFWRDYFYVGNTDAVVRFTYKPGQTESLGKPEKIADLPGKGYREHWTRNVVFNADGTKMYVTVGSESNVSVEPDPLRAAIIEFNPDGTGRRIVAGGTRNPIGLAFHPATRSLWAAVQERDRLGDDLVPDYVTQIRDGGFYGWPYAYVGPNEDPRRKGERIDLVRKAIVPDVLIQAHSAVLGLAFYDGQMFPPEYRGDAFVALHGSWNRSLRTGYKIIRIRFKDGKAVGGYDDFVTGWMLDEKRPEVWGRPVGLLVLRDGSMLITDDGANKIWRVTYGVPGGPNGKPSTK